MKHIPTLVPVCLLACGGLGNQPDDMSAEEHQKAADRAEASAETHRNLAVVGPGPDTPAEGRHWSLAHSLDEHARAHRDAAEALREDEAAACAGLPEGTRDSCPLIGHRVRAVEATPVGVRITYEGADADALLRQLRCHTAHDAKEGLEGESTCPLSEKSLTISTEAVPGGAVLNLSSDDPKVRKRLGEMYVPSVPRS